MVNIKLLAAALFAANTSALVFKAIQYCEGSVGIFPPRARSLESRQTVSCDSPHLVAFADDGTQLTFEGGQQTMELGKNTDVTGNCYQTNGDYNGAAVGVDASDGHYGGGLLHYSTCAGFSVEISGNDCKANINGMEKSDCTETNCNGCSASGLGTCHCNAITY